MKAARKRPGTPVAVIKIGGLYRDRTSGLLVTAEDHELREGRRTGRIVVRAADATLRFPLWLSCRGEDLVEAEVESVSAPAEPTDAGGKP